MKGPDQSGEGTKTQKEGEPTKKHTRSWRALLKNYVTHTLL